MDAHLRRSMFRYYDERASEYEDAYVLGTGTASIPDCDVFRNEAKLLTGIVERFARGRLVDLACGTGYWLPFYAERCTSITLIDQSARMLDECRKKVAALGMCRADSYCIGTSLDALGFRGRVTAPGPDSSEPGSRALRGLIWSWAPSAPWGCIGESRVTQRSITVNHSRVSGLIGDVGPHFMLECS